MVWRNQAAGLAQRPQTGLEVIVTGRLTTYPGRSQYQIIIETMAPAGVGALLAQLERLKAALAAEGLFDPARKRPLPSMPGVIGVVTSPTGAVIRDIIHRLRDRWPCRVIVWPVVVQGEQAAGQVQAAVEGFSAGGAVPRPDLIIVARGGGSVEDLWPFNDEALARAVAASAIPLISAIGHETDTTLVDHVSDRRAPTPTAAAEIATPVLSELAALLADLGRRLIQCGSRAVEHRRVQLAAAAGSLPRPVDLMAIARQRLDIASGRLGSALMANIGHHRQDFTRVSAAIRPALLIRSVQARAEHLDRLAARLTPLAERSLARAGERLSSLEKLRLSFNPDGPLKRGFARVHHRDGRLARAAKELEAGELIDLVFSDGTRSALVDGARSRTPAARAGSAKAADQTELF